MVSWLALSGCITEDELDPEDLGEAQSALTLTERMEVGVKAAYATADVTLATGVWNFDDALLGNTSSDAKLGAQSARLRNSGKITMKFNRTTGAGTVTVRHASYASDANGTWGLFASQNGGSSWTQISTSRTTSGHSLATATFTVNLAGTIRFEIRKLDGGSNRINLDEITITDFGGGGGGGGAISRHTAMGIPAPASTSDANAYLSVKSGYVISYNSGRKVPNWVSWALGTGDLGTAPRQDDFRADDTLPATMAQAQLSDYSGSGYDRGHMCPSADRTLTVTANSQTFYLSNMVPQAGNNNQGPWARLEDDLRDIAQTGKQLYIISGGTFSAGSNTVGNGVVVPDQTFKVVVVLDAGSTSPSAVTTTSRVIGVMMPNENAQISKSADWHGFRVSVDSIEAATGQNFLSDVDAAIQAVIESRVDTQ